MTRDEVPVVHIKQLNVEADYSQVYLVDEGCSVGGFDNAPIPPVGIIRVERAVPA